MCPSATAPAAQPTRPTFSAILSLLALLLQGCGGQGPDTTWEVAHRGVHAATISPGCQYLVVGSIEHGASLWRVQDQERLYNWNHVAGDFSTVTTTAVSADGGYALTVEGASLVLWRTDSGQPQGFWTAPADITSAALTPDGMFALLGLTNQSAVLFNVQQGGVRHTWAHGSRVTSVDLSANGRLAVTGTEDGDIHLWNTQGGDEVRVYSLPAAIDLVRLSPDAGLSFATAAYAGAFAWNNQDTSQVFELPLPRYARLLGRRFTSAQFVDGGKAILLGDGQGRLQTWSLADGKRTGEWQADPRNPWNPQRGTTIAATQCGPGQTPLAVLSDGTVQRF
ncbi:MAG: hypothetical protein SV583_06430 [Pseudomonadota bacterium]|nr:hypothetical protein [Pseudomonadota bacterium]